MDKIQNDIKLVKRLQDEALERDDLPYYEYLSEISVNLHNKLAETQATNIEPNCLPEQ